MSNARSLFNRFLRFVGFFGLIAAGMYLIYQALLYTQQQHLLPAGTRIGGVDVSGMSMLDASSALQTAYNAPIHIHHLEETAEIDPVRAGFELDLEAMLTQAAEQKNSQTIWQGFTAFLFDRPLNSVDIPLQASHDPQALRALVETIVSFLDQPATNPQLAANSIGYLPGKTGYSTDIDASMPQISAALYSLYDRQADLIIQDEEPKEPGIYLLEETLVEQIAEFNGVGSLFVADLETGDEILINADVAMSGISVMKIPIMIEAYRNYYDGTPPPEELALFFGAATQSSDYHANLLLRRVAGKPQELSGYQGADILTESAQRLGLTNTFLVTPYQEPARPNRLSFLTDANSQPDALLDLDQAMQTTAEDIGALLTMLYYCSLGKGTLIAVYPGQLTPQECQELIDIMAQNIEGTLISFGVPATVPVSHKHGWANGTHADAGIIYSPAKPYILAIFLYQPGGYLDYEYSFPIFRDISRTVYNYFNPDAPYLGDPFEELAERGIEPSDDEEVNEAAGNEEEASSTEPAEPSPPGGDG